jgi:hypothetical protein
MEKCVVRPLRNRSFVTVQKKIPRKVKVANVEACPLDWPITEEGEMQAHDGAVPFLDWRPVAWPQ